MEQTTHDRPGSHPRRPQSLQETLAFLRSIVETVRTPLLVLDAELRVLTANRYFYQTFGLRPEDTEDRRLRELGGGEWDVPELRRLLHEVLPAHKSFDDFRVEADFPHLGHRVVLLNARLLHTAGQPDRILLAFEDVTVRGALEQQLRHRAEELVEADHRKDEFLAMLAHELRNPLGPVLAAADLLGRDEVAPAAAGRAREVIVRQVLQMARMVDDLLDASRITRGRITLQRAVIDLHDVVERAVEMVRHHLDARRHRLLLSLPPRPMLLEADPARLQQALANLLNNAAKYTDPGGKVTLLAERDGNAWLVLTVEDSGRGIDPEFLPRVFDLFAQEDRSLERAAGGLGIGLTLVRSIAEIHGGSVTVQSAGPGQGSTFVLRLPAPANLRRPHATLPAGGGQAAEARRILAVDDNADAIEMLGDLLRLQGHEVAVAYDGATGLELARTFRPEVVLLDIGLPGMDGYEVARRLRRMPEADTALLVAVTGYGRAVDRRRGREAGFHHHLVKPLDLDALQHLLAQPVRDGRRSAAVSGDSGDAAS
jgi:two-component system CheB/CheR fusion protein